MKHLFPTILGLTDGIITALIFTSGLISGHSRIPLQLIIKFSLGSSIISAFSYFIAKYSELREELIDTSIRLDPSSPLHLLKGRQGILIMMEAVTEAGISVASGFFGAFITMFPSFLFPGVGHVSIISAIIILGVLGSLISRSLEGGWVRWSVTFVLIGISASLMGIYLNIL